MLLVVADAANAEGKHAHPGLRFVMDASLYSRRQAINLLDELEAEGWIKTTAEGGGRGNATVYDVLVDRPDQARTDVAATAPFVESERVQSQPERVQPDHERVQPRVHPNVVTTEVTTNTLALELVSDPVSAPPTDAQIVFDAWIEATGKDPTRTKFDAGRRRLIEKALKGYPVEDVVAAVRGWRNSPFHRGENDRRKTYNELSLLLRNPEHIERFRDHEMAGPDAHRPMPKAAGAIAEWMAAG